MLATILSSALLAPAAPAATSGQEALGSVGDLYALRVGRAETIANGPLEHAVVLVEGGKIVAVGEDLPVGRGIRIIDRPDWVLTPGWVNCHSRAGMRAKGNRGFDPEVSAGDELYARQDLWQDLLETGVTTLGLYPAGSGIPGQAVAARPHGESSAEMLVAEGVYLSIHLQSNQASKKLLRDAFEKADEHEEKVQKAREKWEKALEKQQKKKKKKSKKDDEEDEDDGDQEEAKDEDAVPEVFEAPEPDEKVAPILALRAQELSALVELEKASDYLHFRDVIEDEDFRWSLFLELAYQTDFYEIAERLGEDAARAVLPTRIALQPSTRRERNVPAELQRAGVTVALVPASDSLDDHRSWPHDVAHLVGLGLDRDAALAAMTLEPARVLGLDERLGSIEEGKDANLLLWNGDPFEPGSRLQAVVLEGRFVVEEPTR